MPTYSSNSGKSFRLARKQNMSVTMDGQLRLASRNLLPDPGLREIEPDGSLRHWRLSGPEVKTARNVYIGPRGQRLTRQNPTPIPAGRSSYNQNLALAVGGAGVPGAKSDLATARHPALYRRTGEARGYPGGLYPVSLAWVVGSLHLPRYRALTDPAPPLYVPLAEGQSYEMPLPEEAAEGALGLAILQGEPDGPGDVLYVQEIIDIRSSMPTTKVMDGPLRTGWRAPRTNQTYCGAFWTLRGPTMRIMSGVRTLKAMRVRTSYKFRTELGISASQGYTDRVIPRDLKKRSLRFFFPPLPPRALAIIPQVQGPDSAWYDIDYGFRGGDVPIIPGWNWSPYILTDDAEAEYKGLMQYNSSERSMVDETGIPGPDAAIEEARSFGRARLAPGPHAVRITDVYPSEGGEKESPPSSPRYITTQSGESLEVDFREEAEEGNVIPNADFEDRKPNGDPKGFSFPAAVSANLSVSARQSVVRFDDSTGRATNEVIFQRERFSLVNAPYCFRGGVRFSRATSGSAQIVVRFYQGGTQTASANLFTPATVSSEQTTDFTCGPAGSGCDIEWPAGTDQASYECRLRGDLAAGARNLAGRFIHIGFFRGLAAPCKGSEDNPVPEEEPETEPYPDGGYMRLVQSPSWAQGKGNGLEFYGTAITPLRRRYFAHGMRVPLDPNRLYVLHGSYSCKGVSAGSEGLPVAVKNTSDRVVDGLGPLFTASGNGEGTFSQIIETGPDAAYAEFDPSTLGAGLVRVWGMQLEYGSIPTAWTDAHAPRGSVAATFRTRTPGLDSYPALAKRLYGIKGLLSAGVASDTPEGTDVSLRLRSRRRETDEWSEYVSDVSELEHTEIVEAEATATTSDLAISPEISELFVRSEPPRSVLLREDGSEYPGGVLVENLPATGYGEATEETPRTDNTRRLRELYEPAPELTGFTLKALTDEGANAVMWDASHGERLFVIEGQGLRRVVRIVGVKLAVNRREKFGEGLYAHTAEDVSAEIIEEEPLVEALPEDVTA